MDLSEVIQNSLIDDNHFNVINNKEINQSFDQPYLNDPVVPINQFDDYVTSNSILNGQQSTIHEKVCCEYQNTCVHPMSNFNIQSQSNCSTCSNAKTLIPANNNNSKNHHDSYVYNCCELKQYPLHCKANSVYDSNNPNCTIKFLHNKFGYESVLQNNNNDDDRPLNLNQTPLINQIYTNDICLNESMSKSMFNDQYSCYFKCNTKTNQIQRSYYSLPHYCMLSSNIMNKNIHTFNNQQDKCIHSILKSGNSVLAPKLDETISHCDNKILSKMNNSTILNITNGMCNHYNFNDSL